jgi:uncharacterized membrane protein
MDLWLVILRMTHIVAGVFWVGAAVTAYSFIEPTVADLGDDGQRYMRQLTKRRRFPEFVTAAAVLNLAAGGILYWRVSGGLQGAWIWSPSGMGFTMGALAAILAAAIAVAFVLPTLKQMERLAVGSAGPTSSTSPSELHRLERRLRLASLGNVLMLTVAVVAMATARYWGSL